MHTFARPGLALGSTTVTQFHRAGAARFGAIGYCGQARFDVSFIFSVAGGGSTVVTGSSMVVFHFAQHTYCAVTPGTVNVNPGAENVLLLPSKYHC